MSTDSSFPTVEEPVDEHEIGDEYETESYENADGFLTKEQEEQLLLDEKTLRETLEEQTRAEKEWNGRIKVEQAQDEYFRLEFGEYPDYDYASGEYAY